MYDFLKTLAISVDSQVTQGEIDALQAAQERKIWLIIIAVAVAVAVIGAFVLPKIFKKIKAKKMAKAEYKAERKRIQSKRK